MSIMPLAPPPHTVRSKRKKRKMNTMYILNIRDLELEYAPKFIFGSVSKA